MLIAEASDGGSGGEEFGSVLAPDMIVDLDAHPDDARGPRLRGFRLHPGERELASLVDAWVKTTTSWFRPAWRSDCIAD